MDTARMRRRRRLLRLRIVLGSAEHVAWTSLLFTAALLVLLCVLLFRDSDLTTFRIDAWTGSARLLPGAGQPAWPADFALSPVPAGCVPSAFTPSTETEVLLTQTAGNTLDIEVTARGTATSAGLFACRNGVGRAAARRVSAHVAAVDGLPPPVLRFIGRLTIGDDIQALDPTPAMLESGIVNMETASLIDRMGRIESRYELDRADRVMISRDGRAGEDHAALSAGLMRLRSAADTDHAGFEVIARASGRSVNILPFGRRDGAPLAIAPNIVSRLQLSAQYLLFGVVGGLLLRLGALTVQAVAGDRREKRLTARRLARLRRRRRATRGVTLAAAAGALATANAVDAATPAAVTAAGRQGQAALFQLNGGCVALTAWHVVEGAAAATLTLEGSAATVRATVVDHAADIALLSVAAPPTSCPELIPQVALRAVLDATTAAQVAIVDKGGERGRIGASVTGNDAMLSRLMLQPLIPRDGRVEKGISGSPVAINGTVVAIVTNVNDLGAERQIIAVPLVEAVRLLPRHLAAMAPPAPAARRYAKYDISWMPAALKKAVQDAREAGARAEAEVERAHATAERARSASVDAQPMPRNLSEFDNTAFYLFTGENGLAETRSQALVIKNKADGWTAASHGLGVSRGVAGSESGRILAGLWTRGTLRSGEVINGTTPSNPTGTGRVTGAWDENGAFVLGSSVSSAGSDVGEWVNTMPRRGYSVKPSGGRVEGSWDAKGQAHGYLVVWDADGSYSAGGRYDHGELVEPVHQPR